jgi:5-(carboxyamino)imidazole ribonucleotide mutase
MGSDSDWPVMKAAAEALAEFDVPFEADVVSAHRMPEEMLSYGQLAAGRGLSVIIAGAGGAAHLPGMLAAVTPLPVIGVPVPLKTLDGMDSLLSIVQMPAGVPVATVAIGNARNAGLLAVRILGARDPGLQQRMLDFQAELRATALEKGATVRQEASGAGRRIGFS